MDRTLTQELDVQHQFGYKVESTQYSDVYDSIRFRDQMCIKYEVRSTQYRIHCTQYTVLGAQHGAHSRQ